MTSKIGSADMRRENDGGSRPVPDPTVLTTQQLQREIMMLRELVDTRFSGMDRAILLLQNMADKSPTINEVYVKHEEKFNSIALQFVERDARTEQTSKDSKVAVDAALQAAKEAVGEQNKSNALSISKSEAAFTKQIDQIGVIISTMTSGLNDKIDDIKNRITGNETSISSLQGRALALAGFGALFGGVVGALAVKVMS
jgi:hypothetical protein